MNIIKQSFKTIQKTPFKVIDLTHTITPNIPTWVLKCGYDLYPTVDYKDNKSEPFRTQYINHFRCGIGTHIDVPSHCIEGGPNVDQIPLEGLIAPAVMIDISDKGISQDQKLQVEDIKHFEERNGKIDEGSCIIVKTGWEVHWNNPKIFHGNYKFPSVSKEAGQFLLEKRKASGLAIDTLSADRGDEGFPIHRMFLGEGKYLIENIANLNLLPAKGFYLFSLPIKLAEATEAPIRCFALKLDQSNVFYDCHSLWLRQ